MAAAKDAAAPAASRAGDKSHIEQEQAQDAAERIDDEGGDRAHALLARDPADEKRADQHHHRCVEADFAQDRAHRFPSRVRRPALAFARRASRSAVRIAGVSITAATAMR